MNAIQFLLSNSAAANHLPKGYSRESQSENSNFLTMLCSQLNNNEKPSATQQTTADQQEVLHLVQTTSEEMEWSNILSNPIVEELLSELPFPLRIEVEKLLQSNGDIQLVQNEEQLEPAHVIALLLQIVQVLDMSNKTGDFQENSTNANDLRQSNSYYNIDLETINQIERMISILRNDVNGNITMSKYSNETIIFLDQMSHLLETRKAQFLSNHSNTKIMENTNDNNSSIKVMQTGASPLTSKNINVFENRGANWSATVQAANESHLTKLIQDSVGKIMSLTDESKTNFSRGIVLPVQGMPVNPVQQFILHVGEVRTDFRSAEQLVRQFQSILGRSSLVQFPNGINQLTIKLFPEHLGRLDVRLTEQNGVIVAKLMTTTQAAKGALEAQLHQLKQAFVAQNIQVEKIEVATQHQQQGLNQSEKENENGQHQNQDEPQNSEEDIDNNDQVDFQELLEETFNKTV